MGSAGPPPPDSIGPSFLDPIVPRPPEPIGPRSLESIGPPPSGSAPIHRTGAAPIDARPVAATGADLATGADAVTGAAPASAAPATAAASATGSAPATSATPVTGEDLLARAPGAAHSGSTGTLPRYEEAGSPEAGPDAPSWASKRRRRLAAALALMVLAGVGAAVWATSGGPEPATAESGVTVDAGASPSEGVAATADATLTAQPAGSGSGQAAADSAQASGQVSETRTGDASSTPAGMRAGDAAAAGETRPAAPGPARLRLVGTLPDGARLIVDGSVVPRPADGVLVLSPGVHDFRVEAPGHRPATLRRELAAGVVGQWQPRLAPLPGPTRPADPAPTPAQGAGGPPPATGRAFADVARAEIERVARELESGQIRPSMPATLEAEWRRLFQQGTALRVGVREIQTDSAAATATFLLVVADGGGRTLMTPADYEASFLRLAGGWRLTELFRR